MDHSSWASCLPSPGCCREHGSFANQGQGSQSEKDRMTSWFRCEVLPQVEDFMYLGVLYRVGGEWSRRLASWIGVAYVEMFTIYRFVAMKRELGQKATVSVYRSIYVPPLTGDHDLWVMIYD